MTTLRSNLHSVTSYRQTLYEHRTPMLSMYIYFTCKQASFKQHSWHAENVTRYPSFPSLKYKLLQYSYGVVTGCCM